MALLRLKLHQFALSKTLHNFNIISECFRCYFCVHSFSPPANEWADENISINYFNSLAGLLRTLQFSHQRVRMSHGNNSGGDGDDDDDDGAVGSQDSQLQRWMSNDSAWCMTWCIASSVCLSVKFLVTLCLNSHHRCSLFAVAFAGQTVSYSNSEPEKFLLIGKLNFFTAGVLMLAVRQSGMTVKLTAAAAATWLASVGVRNAMQAATVINLLDCTVKWNNISFTEETRVNW